MQNLKTKKCERCQWLRKHQSGVTVRSLWLIIPSIVWAHLQSQPPDLAEEHVHMKCVPCFVLAVMKSSLLLHFVWLVIVYSPRITNDHDHPFTVMRKDKKIWYTDNMQEFSGVGVLGPLWDWQQRWIWAAEVRKISFVEKKRERLHGDMRQDGNQWSCGSGWELGFYSLFLLPEGNQTFPEKQKCLPDYLSPFGTSCSPPFRFTWKNPENIG
jgi:hypothetical protein